MSELTQERLKELLHYDPEMGIFTWKVCPQHKVANGSVAGSLNHQGYLAIGVDRSIYQAHRLAWFYVHGEWPEQIDHISGVKNDNRAHNLRSVTHKENCKNRCINRNNASGVTGVTWHKRNKRWEPHIMVNRKQKCLGSFVGMWDAICARKSAEFKNGFHANHGRQAC